MDLCAIVQMRLLVLGWTRVGQADLISQFCFLMRALTRMPGSRLPGAGGTAHWQQKKLWLARLGALLRKAARIWMPSATLHLAVRGIARNCSCQCIATCYRSPGFIDTITGTCHGDMHMVFLVVFAGSRASVFFRL